MSRVERFSISRNFPASGVESIKKMVARIGRREDKRIRVVGEILLSNPRRGVPKRERSRGEKKIEIIFQWPLASGRKRY